MRQLALSSSLVRSCGGAAAFKLTQQEVQRITIAQQQHASATSLWGRTWSAGSRIVEAARVVATEAQARGASGSGGSGGG